ncbi:hypothetical protein [Spirosoma flavum]
MTNLPNFPGIFGLPFEPMQSIASGSSLRLTLTHKLRFGEVVHVVV